MFHSSESNSLTAKLKCGDYEWVKNGCGTISTQRNKETTYLC